MMPGLLQGQESESGESPVRNKFTSDQGSRTRRAASGCHGERRGFNIGDHMHAGHAVSFERLSDTA
jgi:hypothetical protein